MLQKKHVQVVIQIISGLSIQMNANVIQSILTQVYLPVNNVITPANNVWAQLLLTVVVAMF